MISYFITLYLLSFYTYFLSKLDFGESGSMGHLKLHTVLLLMDWTKER